jgi:serine/threonine-protein kinase
MASDTDTGGNGAPERLGKYQIRRTLGRGAMGIVYEGFDPVIERRVAIKTVALDAAADPETAEALERFKREAQAAGRLTHPNIVGVYDYGETENLAYIVMEFVEGETLKALLDRGERFALADTASLMRALLDGLAYSHAQGVIHRDIKPANVMVTPEKRVKLADFGIARIESSSLTQAGTMIGTPAYMSPEQFMGQPVDARTDIYSTGVLLYQLLTGEKPFEGSVTSIMHKVLNTEPPRPSALAVAATPALDAVVARAMAKRPDDRYATAAAFAAALETALGAGTAGEATENLGEATLIAPRAPAAAPDPTETTAAQAAPASGPAPSPAASAPRRGGRLPLLAGVAVAALLIAGGGAWWVTRSSAPQHAASPTSAHPATASEKPSGPGGAAPAQPASTTPAGSGSGSGSGSAPSSTSTSSGTSSTSKASAGSAPSQSASANPGSGNSGSAPAAESAAASSHVTTTTKATTPPAAPAQPAQAAVHAQTPPGATASPSSGQTSTPAAAAAAQPSSPTGSQIRGTLASALQDVPCALLNGTVDQGGQNTSVTLAGMIGSTERDALKSALAAPPVTVQSHVRSFTGPYCGVISAIRPFTELFPAAGSSGGELSLALAHGATRLKAGQLIVIHLGLPDYAAHLQVDYISSNGAIYPLYPESAAQKAALSPGQDLVLGSPDTKGGPRWAVGAPFGRDMILAIAASEPIGAAPRTNATVGSFLPQLRKSLAALKQQGADVSAAGLLVETVPK